MGGCRLKWIATALTRNQHGRKHTGRQRIAAVNVVVDRKRRQTDRSEDGQVVHDPQDLIVEADVVEGGEIEALIARFFARADVSYLHVHYARRGCYACRVDRV